MTAEPPPRLHAAMRRHGDVTLLQVRWHDATHPAGTVESAAPGLLLGYIDRFGDGRLPAAIVGRVGAWVRLAGRSRKLLTSGGKGCLKA
jgi:hypothetical protein